MAAPHSFRYVSKKRRVREDRRFVSGQATYVSDVTPPGTLHVALLTSPYACARIAAVDAAEALAMPGVHLVVGGAELAAAADPLLIGVDAPLVKRYPLAVERARYAGEWVAAVVAESRALAEDAREKIRIAYEPLPFLLDGEAAYEAGSTPVHPDHGSNVLLDQRFVWGDVDGAFAAAPHKLGYRVKWGRSATVPIETFGVVASWDPWRQMLDVWASIQMPKFADQIARALRMPLNEVCLHQDVDVGGSYGVKRGIKHAVLAGYLSRRLARPVKLIEDRLENMRGGDMHGPERTFDVELAFDGTGVVHAMRMRALDNVGAYAGRSPLQLGKPVGSIVGPYRIGAVAYHAIAVTSNKTPQEAVRGFGQAPTNYAIETGIDRVAEALGLDRLEVRRRNFIRAEEFPYLIPSGTAYDSGDYHTVVAKTLDRVGWEGLVAERERLRASGLLAGIGVASCLEPSGGNASFEPLLNPKNATTTWMESCRIMVDALGAVTVTIHTTSSGQGHETLAATVAGEALQIDPDRIRVVRPTSLESLPTNSPVGSRMAIMLGGAVHGAAGHVRDKLIAIAAHRLETPAERPALSRRRRRASRLRPGDRVDGPRDHRAPLFPSAAARHGPGPCRRSHPPGADGGRHADARRPRADVPLLLLRAPRGAGVDRSGDRQAAAPPLGRRPRLRHGHQPGHRARHDAGRHRPRHRRGAAGGVRLRRRGPARDPELHGLSAALRARGAGGGDRAPRHALAPHRARPEGLGRVRLPRRARGRLECDQRRRAPAGAALRGAAHAHLRHRRRYRRGVGQPALREVAA